MERIGDERMIECGGEVREVMQWSLKDDRGRWRRDEYKVKRVHGCQPAGAALVLTTVAGRKNDAWKRAKQRSTAL